MRRREKLACIIWCLASLSIFLAGCQVASRDLATPATAAGTSTPVRPTGTHVIVEAQKTEVSPIPYPMGSPPLERPPATIETTKSKILAFFTPVPLTTPQSETTSPALLYISEDTLFASEGEHAREILSNPSDLGAIDTATLTGNELLLLRERGLQVIDLARGTLTLVDSFQQPALFGACNLGTSGSLVICWYVSDWIGSFETFVIVYQPESGTVLAKWSYPGSVSVLGQTADGASLYLLPRGQDPAYGDVLEVDLYDAELQESFIIEGYGTPSLSPDQRFFIAATLDSTLRIYDLADQTLGTRTIALPHPPSHHEEAVWSDEGDYYYFSLHKDTHLGNLSSTSLGLWRLDVRTGELVQLVSGIPDRGLLVITSMNQAWQLVRHSDESRALRIHIPTEAIDEFTLPDLAMLTLEEAVFRSPSMLSDDGGWLYYVHYRDEKRYILHLPSGEVYSFEPPLDALAIGWR